MELRYLNELFDSLPVGVLIADDDAVYRGVNRAACELLARPREQILGMHVSEVVAPGRINEVNAQWKSFLRDGTQAGLFDIELPDGRLRRVQFNARAHFVPGLSCSFMNEVRVSAPVANVELPFITMCAWTKRVRVENEWQPIEEYLLRAHGVMVSHGISPDALSAVNTG
jgi:PAS domain S-box-containing protein